MDQIFIVVISYIISEGLLFTVVTAFSPTGQPTRQPSSQPSRQPSRQPTNQPTRQPTIQPTMKPSSQPSVQPTSRPSSQPTSAPTTQATIPRVDYSMIIAVVAITTAGCFGILTTFFLGITGTTINQETLIYTDNNTNKTSSNRPIRQSRSCTRLLEYLIQEWGLQRGFLYLNLSKNGDEVEEVNYSRDEENHSRDEAEVEFRGSGGNGNDQHVVQMATGVGCCGCGGGCDNSSCTGGNAGGSSCSNMVIIFVVLVVNSNNNSNEDIYTIRLLLLLLHVI